MQICQLTTGEAERVQGHPGFVPDCHFHKHLSKRDAHQAVADGKVRFVNNRAVVAVGTTPLSGYWYDETARKNDGRYPGTAKSGTAQSGWVRTHQLVNFMPRGMKHRVRDIRVCSAASDECPRRVNSQRQPGAEWIAPRSVTTAEFDNAWEGLMGNEELRNRRKQVGMPQFLLAQRSGVTRMRLSLFETGQVCLTVDEIAAVRRAMKEYIAQKAAQFAKALNCDDAVAV